MNRIIRNIATVCLGIVVWSWLPAQLYAQCKSGGSATTKGEFTINGTKVSVQGDGGGVATAPNNIPIKICEGEVIKLKSSLAISSLSNVNYWITPYSTYNGRPRAMGPADLISAAGSYTTTVGDFDVKMATKDASNPDGFNTYNGPGLYVISQGDNSTPTGASTGDFHHACQVIEIIAPQQPVATVSVCSGGQVQITLPTNPANNFDDYEIVFNATSGNFNPILKTGKPTAYPFSISSGTTLPDNQDRIITIKGSSITGGCPSPVNNLGVFSISGSIISRPGISSIVGTTKADEFKLAVSAQNGITRNIYMRDPLIGNGFIYIGTPFKNFASTATSGLDSIDIKVADPTKTYCFQVEALDANCPTSGGNTALRSNEEICTTPIKVTPQSNKNVITWNRAIGSVLGGTFAFYQVERL
ncbi:MAG: hypothetical protein MUF58_08405, partial [Arcicella sp.]|nr:hypothetical protein [Arcicella sp.]